MQSKGMCGIIGSWRGDGKEVPDRSLLVPFLLRSVWSASILLEETGIRTCIPFYGRSVHVRGCLRFFRSPVFSGPRQSIKLD